MVEDYHGHVESSIEAVTRIISQNPVVPAIMDSVTEVAQDDWDRASQDVELGDACERESIIAESIITNPVHLPAESIDGSVWERPQYPFQVNSGSPSRQPSLDDQDWAGRMADLADVASQLGQLETTTTLHSDIEPVSSNPDLGEGRT